MTKKELPGTIVLNHGRYWWQVKLPGDIKRRSIPLKPKGSNFATTDLAVAEVVAADLYQQYLMKKQPSAKRDKTIASLMKDYIAWAKVYYPKKEGALIAYSDTIAYALRFLKPYARESPNDFGPLKLKQIQAGMIQFKLARKTINNYISIIRALFKWGVSEERVSSEIHTGLTTVLNLHKGRSKAVESKKIVPADPEAVQKIFPYLSSVLKGMVQVQMLTGMRSSELCTMRPGNISPSGGVWLYRPGHHKTENKGASRIIPIGPQAQAILEPFIKRFCPLLCPEDQPLRKPNGYVFSPMESERERRDIQHQNRKTDPNAGNHPGSNRKDDPQWKPGEYYDQNAYRKAISRAIAAAKRAGVVVPYFHPHQLRHTAGTRVRAAFDLDTSKALLGHSHISATEIYAELDLQKAIEAAKEIG